MTAVPEASPGGSDVAKGPAAVLWDFDGTLVDSEPLWGEIERDLARELGGELPDDYHEHTIGGQIRDTASYILTQVGSDADPDAVAAELWERAKRALATREIPWLPGVEALVAGLRAAGVPQGVVSSGHRQYLRTILDRLDPSPFAVVVAGDEVTQGKPHPEPYLRACALLGVSPAHCLAVEDSATGAASANAAGCAVLGVPTLADLPGGPRRTIVASLAGVDVAGLAALYAATTSGVGGGA